MLYPKSTNFTLATSRRVMNGGASPSVATFIIDNNDSNNGQANRAQCGDGHTFPSTKMDTLSRIALHEMTHYSSVGPPSALGQQIIDVTNADGCGAYDPDRCHGLIDPAQDDNPAVTEAQDAYFSFACTTAPSNPGDYFTDPPAYDPGDDDSDEAARGFLL